MLIYFEMINSFLFEQSMKNEFSELFNIMLMLIKQFINKVFALSKYLTSIKGFVNLFRSHFKTLKLMPAKVNT